MEYRSTHGSFCKEGWVDDTNTKRSQQMPTQLLQTVVEVSMQLRTKKDGVADVGDEWLTMLKTDASNVLGKSSLHQHGPVDVGNLCTDQDESHECPRHARPMSNSHSSPVLFKFKHAWMFTIMFMLVMKIPGSNAHGAISVEIRKCSMLFSSFKKVMDELRGSNWVRDDVRIIFVILSIGGILST